MPDLSFEALGVVRLLRRRRPLWEENEPREPRDGWEKAEANEPDDGDVPKLPIEEFLQDDRVPSSSVNVKGLLRPEPVWPWGLDWRMAEAMAVTLAGSFSRWST